MRDACRSIELDLSAWMDGELSVARAETVRSHVEACRACSAEQQMLAGVGSTLRRWDAAETRYLATNAFRSRVLEQIGAPASAAGSSAAGAPDRRGRLVLVRAAAAAVVVVATGAAVAMALPRGIGDDAERIARLEAQLQELTGRAETGPDGAVAVPSTSTPIDVARLEDWQPVVTPAEDTAALGGDTAPAEGVERALPEAWEEHEDRWIVGDSFPALDEFRRRERDLRFRADVRRRLAAGANVSPERPTTDRPAGGPLASYLGGLRVSEGTFAPYAQVQVWPIESDAPEGVVDAPLTASEALREKSLEVTESARGGAVLVENSDRRGRAVMLLAGDVLHGGRRDRVVAEDVILAAGQRRQVRSVATGDARRSRRRYSRSDGMAPVGVRALLAAGAGEAAIDGVVEAALPWLGAAGGNGLDAVYGNDELLRRADSYVSRFTSRLDRPRVVGFAVAAGGDLLGVEVFGDHDTFDALSRRALRSYVLEALARPRLEGSTPGREVVTAALTASHRATRDDQTAFVDTAANLRGYGLLESGHVHHAIVFTDRSVAPGAASAAAARGAAGALPTAPGTVVDDEPGTENGPGRGDESGGTGLSSGSER